MKEYDYYSPSKKSFDFSAPFPNQHLIHNIEPLTRRSPFGGGLIMVFPIKLFG